MKGQTLLEVLVALGASAVVVSAIASVVLSSLNNAYFGKNQNLARNYAQQGLEVVRRMRDNDFAAFLTLSGTYCLDKRCSQIAANPAYCWVKIGTCGQNADIFVREVTIEKNSSYCNPSPPPPPQPTPITSNTARVTVNVSWSDSRCTSTSDAFCHKIDLSTCMSDYRLVPTP